MDALQTNLSGRAGWTIDLNAGTVTVSLGILQRSQILVFYNIATPPAPNYHIGGVHAQWTGYATDNNRASYTQVQLCNVNATDGVTFRGDNRAPTARLTTTNQIYEIGGAFDDWNIDNTAFNNAELGIAFEVYNTFLLGGTTVTLSIVDGTVYYYQDKNISTAGAISTAQAFGTTAIAQAIYPIGLASTSAFGTAKTTLTITGATAGYSGAMGTPYLSIGFPTAYPQGWEDSQMGGLSWINNESNLLFLSGIPAPPMQAPSVWRVAHTPASIETDRGCIRCQP